MAIEQDAPPNITEIDEDKHVKLSPFAQEFHPIMEQNGNMDVHLCIFNDGVPSLVLASDSDVSGLLHGIADEAIDEGFPPSAAEAAELEAVEEFVEMMATLADMEAREERARISFDHVQKRWETRRSEGLIGRPNRAKHSVEPVDHNLPGLKQPSSTALVKSDLHAQRMLMKHQKLHRKDLEHTKHAPSSKRASGKQQFRAIQQPRKVN